MTDGSKAEKNGLKNIWPEAPQLLCHFHVAQNEWDWILKAKNGVAQENRRLFMISFQNVSSSFYYNKRIEINNTTMDNHCTMISDNVCKGCRGIGDSARRI